ncbi:MAG TPA: HAMP domain-containing protein, partial [Acidimicrobiales bacterium]|nr:HAMP domain-containing protein [Acidimicrobiales bacterium]
MTLRRRLLYGVLLLVVLGLALADVATWLSLRSYLYGQVDNQLSPALSIAERQFQFVAPPGGNSPNLAAQVFPVGTVAAIVSPSGALERSEFLAGSEPGSIPVIKFGGLLETSSATNPPDELFSTSSTDGTRYRVLAAQGTIAVGDATETGFVVVAIPLTNVTDTLRQLELVEALVTFAVLVALTAAVLMIIRIGLRPLVEMTETADAIAAGEMSRRVPHADQRTEVGQLAAALNAMLGQIEQAFAGKEASESKLRRFVADASHELRTPLTSIRGYAELFRRGAAHRPDDLATAMRRIE